MSSSWKSVDIKSEDTPITNGQSSNINNENAPIPNGGESTLTESPLEKCSPEESSPKESPTKECASKESSSVEKINDESDSKISTNEGISETCSRDSFSPKYDQKYFPANPVTSSSQETLKPTDSNESISNESPEEKVVAVTQSEPVKEEPTVVQELITPVAAEPVKPEPSTPASTPEPIVLTEEIKSESSTPAPVPEPIPEAEEPTKVEPSTPASTPEPTSHEEEPSYPADTIAAQPETQILAVQSEPISAAPVEAETTLTPPTEIKEENLSVSEPIPQEKQPETVSSPEPTEPIQVPVPTSLLIPTNEEQKPLQNGSANTDPTPQTSPPEPLTAEEEIPKPDIVKQQKEELKAKHTEAPMRERAISPVLVPGKLKSNIAFFENLKNK